MVDCTIVLPCVSDINIGIMSNRLDPTAVPTRPHDMRHMHALGRATFWVKCVSVAANDDE